MQQALINQLFVFGFTIGRQTHQLIFAGINFETAQIRKGRIQQTEGMRESDLFQDFDTVVTTSADRSGRPFSNAVHGKDCRALKRRWEEGAGRMRLVMLKKQDLTGRPQRHFLHRFFDLERNP